MSFRERLSLAGEQSYMDRMIPWASHYHCEICGGWWHMPRSSESPAVVLLTCPEHEEGVGRLEEREEP